MKAKFLFLASLLALTGCGGDALSDVTAGDTVEKNTFEGAFLVSNILLNSNYHVEVTFNQTGLPPEAKVEYSKAMDFANKKIKVNYNRINEPYYFDFSRSNDSASYSFDVYTPLVNREANQAQYSVRQYNNYSISNDFMGINDLLGATSGLGLTMMSGLQYAKFTLSGGVYQLSSPIKVGQSGVEMTFDVIKASFAGNNVKDLYYHATAEIPASPTETYHVVQEARLIFSNFGGVSVTLPDVVD